LLIFTNKMVKTTVIFPARNEESIIEDVIKDVRGYLKDKKYQSEIIVVVNGSNDKTEEIVRMWSKKDKSIIFKESKPGYGYALKKGLQEAKGEYVIVYNVDFYDLRFIDLVDVDLLGKDVIIGSKLVAWSMDLRSYSRKVVSRLFNFFLQQMFGFRGSDTHGIKIMRKKVVSKVLSKCKTDSGIFDTEFVIRAQREGFQFADLPVTREEKRPPRFSKRLMDTPVDIYNLYKALKNE
jgi:glycosyltransferase involved in cell wall biosynthesis